MWNRGALSVFNDNWADNFVEDPASPSDGPAEQPPAQGVSGGQISPGGTEYLNLSSGDVFTRPGTDRTDSWNTSTSTANPSTTVFSPLGPNSHLFGLIDPRDGTLSHPDITNLNANNNYNTQSGFSQDVNMDTSGDFPPFEWPFDALNPAQADPQQFLNQDSLMDFDIQQYIAQNPNVFQQQLPGPFAPLSPALTPPPTSFVKQSDSLITSDESSSTRQLDQKPAFETDDQRWEATMSRSHAADRSFLYGVRTTKIFCRPSCASRRASRKNVIFFSFPGAIEAAIQAEFRPCKRCKPETLGTADTGILGVIKVLRLVINDAASPFSPDETSTKLETLAEVGGLSAFHFHRLFKSTTKLTPGELIAACRSLALGDALGMDSHSHSDNKHNQGESSQDLPAEGTTPSATTLIANSTKWNPRTARKALGSVSPTDYVAGCRSLKLHRITIDTAQGPTSIAYSPHRGDILAVLIGSDTEERLKTRFPGLEPSEFHASRMEKCVKELQEVGVEREGDIPEDLKGWLWRARVWVRVVRDNVLKDSED